ncbi:MAG: mechanosensitive ion channel [Elusimicrobia bacterium]|nr:mechanosensitive ion channel [Elusimicrobiota bacterium]
MNFSDALLASFGPGFLVVLPLLLTALVGLAALARSSRARLLGAGLTTLGAAAAFLLAAALMTAGGTGAAGTIRTLRGAGRLLATVAGINAAGLIVFDVLLPRLKIRIAALARDLILAAAYALGVLAALTAAGVNLSGLVATSAVMTAIVAFSLQDTLGNILGGMVLQLDRTLQAGDWVRVGSDEGVVREIRWRQTQISTAAGDVVVVPNSALMKGVVTALGRREGGRRRRYLVTFSVPYHWGPGLVIAAVEKALRDDPPAHVAADPAPSCVVTDFLDGRAAYTLRVWITDLNSDVSALSATRLRIFYGLAREGIALATEPSQAVAFEDGKIVRERRDADETKRRLAALRGVDLFRDLTEEEFATLAGRLKTAPFAPGEIMTRQGAIGHWLYIIAQGEAEVQLHGDGGGAEKVARLKAGDFMGEMALLTGEPRAATVIAVENVACYRLDRDGFRDILARRPEIAESISKVLVERRVALESARGTMDARRLDGLRASQSDMLSRIRRFFALS